MNSEHLIWGRVWKIIDAHSSTSILEHISGLIWINIGNDIWDRLRNIIPVEDEIDKRT